MAEWILLDLTIFFMLLGIVGVFLPLLPGIELIWLAALGYGILHGFTWGGVFALLGITVLLGVGLSSDIWITGMGLKSTGTSLASTLLGALLLVAGSIFFTPLVGLLLGLAVIAAMEFRRHRNWKKAASSAGSAILGCGISIIFKLFIGLGMIGIWVVWVLWG
jgi:uncharacterized protein YqgC (DUF456 family)